MNKNLNIVEKQNNQHDTFGRVDCIVGLPPLQLNEIYNDDSFELCKRVPAKTVDLILEDMPYNTTACEWDVKIDLELYWKTRLRILKPTGVIILTGSQPFTTDLINSNREMFKYEWIWDKKMAGNIASANKVPLKVHENVLVFYKRANYNPQFHNDYTEMYGQLSQIKSESANLQCDTKTLSGQRGYPRSIISKMRPNNLTDGGLHPTQKPVGLFEYLIRTYTNEGDLVFDGFGGSGTTAIAAHKSKRNFIVIEKEKKYFDLAKRRLDNERAQLTML